MQVDIITRPEKLAHLKANWDRVYDADPEANFFLSWDWIVGRLDTGWGQWIVLAARDDRRGPDYVAFFPLRLLTLMAQKGYFWNELVVAGSPTSDYTGLICEPRFEAAAIPAFARELLKRHWAKLTLHGFRASRKRELLFLRAFPERDIEAVEIDGVDEADGLDNLVCPFAKLPGDWETYLAGLSANTRQKARRLLKQVETSDAYRITHADASTIERDVEMFGRFWAAKWSARQNDADGEIRANLERIVMGCFESGTLIMPVLWRGEAPLGALALIVDKKSNGLLYYAAARDLSFDKLPVGLVLHAYSIRLAIERGFTTYEFLRGNEPFKYSFANDERRTKNIVVKTRSRRNLGTKLDRLCLPNTLRQVMRNHKAGNLAQAMIGYRQILDADPQCREALTGYRDLANAQARGQVLAGPASGAGPLARPPKR
jgi:CelD/BcsL family acetyltransferase involved in cellulose biosynthesis